MKRSIRIIAVSTFASLFALAAHAQTQGEGAAAADIAPPAHLKASAQDVKAVVPMSLNMREGSANVIGELHSGLSRQSVKADALMAARSGTTRQGEIAAM